MARTGKSRSCSFVLYSYEYEHGGHLVRVNAYWESIRKVRNEIKVQRSVLLRQGRSAPLPDMRILKIETVQVNRKTIARLLSEPQEGLDFFFRAQTVIETISSPQVRLI